MPVTRTLDRVRTVFEDVLNARSAPDDRVDFDASMALVDMSEDEGEEEGYGLASAVSLYVALWCPEIGEGSRSMCHVMVPMNLLDSDEDIISIANDLWERLQSGRVLVGLDLDESDSPTG